MKCFGLSLEDAQDKNVRKLRVKLGASQNPETQKIAEKWCM